MNYNFYLMIREPFRTQYQIYLQKHFPDYTIIPSNTEVFCEYRLKKDWGTNPFLILCDSDLGLKDASGTGCPRIAVSHRDNTGESLMNAPWLIQSPSALTEDFLREIYCRHHALPLVILSTDHFRLRELASDDLAGLMKLQSENGENPAACFFPKKIFSGTDSDSTDSNSKDSDSTHSDSIGKTDSDSTNSDSIEKKAREEKGPIISSDSPEPAESYLNNYISHQYPFYGYGIYAIEKISDQDEAMARSSCRPMKKKKEGLIGIAGFHERQDWMEVGYALFQKYQGRGIMSEILPALINYGIEKYEFEDLQASISAANEASIKLAEKCGLKIHKL